MEKRYSRTQNSLLNMVTAVFAQILVTLLNFIGRTILIQILGVEYLGVQGVLRDLMSMLSFAELGFGTAISYYLFKPLQMKQWDVVYALMLHLKRAYTWIGGIIVVLGSILYPFILQSVQSEHVMEASAFFILYMICLLANAATYLFSYRTTLLFADQKSYKNNIFSSIFKLGNSIARILVLVLTRNFILYMIIEFLTNLLMQIFLSEKIKHWYPHFKDMDKVSLSGEQKENIRKDIVSIVWHKMGKVIKVNSDNLLISALVGLRQVGICSNYRLLIQTIQYMAELMLNSASAGVGNMVAEKSPGDARCFQVYRMFMMITCTIAGTCGCILVCTVTPFMHVWLGKNYELNDYTVWILIFVFYLEIVRVPTLVYRDGIGQWGKDRYAPIVETLLNLIFSFLLGRQYGVFGVYAGTAISLLTVPFWLQPYLLYRYMFCRKFREYGKMCLAYVFSALIIWWLLVQWTNWLFPSISLISVIGRCLVSGSCFVMIYGLALWRSNSFVELRKMGLHLIQKHGSRKS